MNNTDLSRELATPAEADALTEVDNSDIDPPEIILAQYERLRPLLKDSVLIARFRVLDEKSKKAKSLFVKAGILSIGLGLLPPLASLFVSVTQLTARPLLASLFFLPSLLSLGVMLYLKIGKALPYNWLLPMFERERLRHWHFQKFLDGEYVAQCLANPEALTTRLQSDFPEGFQPETRFARYQDSGKNDLFFEPRPYPPAPVANQMLNGELLQEVQSALLKLRVGYQIGYARNKTDPSSQFFTIAKTAEIFSAISRIIPFLLGAIFFYVIAHSLLATVQKTNLPPPVIQAVFTAGLLSVVSAFGRLVSTGFTPAEENESYNAYRKECELIQERFLHSSSSNSILALVALEQQSCDELRRFIRIKRNSGFWI